MLHACEPCTGGHSDSQESLQLSHVLLPFAGPRYRTCKRGRHVEDKIYPVPIAKCNCVPSYSKLFHGEALASESAGLPTCSY